jgi:hypothetical protein
VLARHMNQRDGDKIFPGFRAREPLRIIV